MINLPTDSIPKLTAFVGIALSVYCLSEEDRSFTQFTDTLEKSYAASAEMSEASKLLSEAFNSWLKHHQQADEAIDKLRLYKKSGQPDDRRVRRASLIGCYASSLGLV